MMIEGTYPEVAHTNHQSDVDNVEERKQTHLKQIHLHIKPNYHYTEKTSALIRYLSIKSNSDDPTNHTHQSNDVPHEINAICWCNKGNIPDIHRYSHTHSLATHQHSAATLY